MAPTEFVGWVLPLFNPRGASHLLAPGCREKFVGRSAASHRARSISGVEERTGCNQLEIGQNSALE